ncbi:hypothetical protein J7382_15140 [Shimia sp. R11_0]|uniref:ankyrin repeat domain-containing protein n=1 Tax=Shimia sp. R11_0 TaxID=2821096 RepID=UPI001ADA8C61|nr:ankyrin repeat domain-containing protein [Shimia sp. R11_0]MBO9478881.1 hypothetical protein [Shimia sp. R11_0]
MRLLICAAILTGNVATCAVASETAAPATPPSDAHQVITTLSKDIYRLSERSGGTPEQWRTLEERALTALKHLEGQSPETLVAQDAKGRTPLMLAASAGYLPIVRALLENASVTASIEHKNPEGADAYDLALLAAGST